jgi:hypothetical protein
MSIAVLCCVDVEALAFLVECLYRRIEYLIDKCKQVLLASPQDHGLMIGVGKAVTACMTDAEEALPKPHQLRGPRD